VVGAGRGRGRGRGGGQQVTHPDGAWGFRPTGTRTSLWVGSVESDPPPFSPPLLRSCFGGGNQDATGLTRLGSSVETAAWPMKYVLRGLVCHHEGVSPFSRECEGETRGSSRWPGTM
jgi:hypothetical protein